MSTQDRAIRGGEVAQQEGLESEGAAAAAGGALEPARLRAMHRRWIQRKASGPAAAAARRRSRRAAARRSAAACRHAWSARSAPNLSGVRVHTGGESAEAAESLGARAFTVGSDVHFGRGEFAPGSKEGDRLLAHELTHVVQGQKSGVQRKADAAHGDSDGGEHGDHEAGGHEVSEPGDAAEKEADAMGDHAADELHGGGAGGEHGAAGGEHGAPAGEQAGGKQISASSATPKVAASPPAVGRKIFRAGKPGAAARGAKAAPATAPSAAAASSAPQKSKEELAKEKRIAEATADMNALEAGDPKLALKVALALQTVDKDVASFPQNEAVKAFKVFVNARKQLIIDKCQEEVAPLLAALDGTDEKSPASADKLGELKKSPVIEKWSRNAICGPYTKDKHPRLELFTKTLDKKLAANHDAIGKQKQHQKEEDERKKAATAQPEPPSAAATSSSSAPAHKPAATANAGVSAQATPAATSSSSASAAKPNAKAAAQTPPPAATAPTAAPTSTSAPANAPAAPAAAPHKDTPPTNAQSTPASPAASGAPTTTTTSSSTPATTGAAPATAHDAKTPDAAASGTADKTASAPATTTTPTAQTSAAGPQGGPPAANQANEVKKQELTLKKEVAIARVRTALAAAEDKWKIFGAALEVLNIGTMLAKGFLAAHGIELPKEAISPIKDALGAIGKGKLTKAQIDALFAVVEIQSIETVDEINTLFDEADSTAAASQLHKLSAKLSQEEALKREALALMAKKADKPNGAEKPNAPTEQKHGDKEESSKDSDAEASVSSSASDKDKDTDGKKKGFGKRFKHAAEEAYEKGIKGSVEAESDAEEKSPDFKMAAQQFGNVLDPAKTVVALGDALKSHFKDLKSAKQAQADAEKALAVFLAEHSGKPLPNYAAPVPGA